MNFFFIFILSIVFSFSYSFSSFASDFNSKDLLALLEKEKISSVESLLAKLPKTFLQNYTLQFQGTGLQQASLENPRVLLFGERGKLVLTFNGDESQHQFEHVEVLGYSDEKEEFELFDVDFKNQTLTKNPPICLPVMPP